MKIHAILPCVCPAKVSHIAHCTQNSFLAYLLYLLYLLNLLNILNLPASRARTASPATPSLASKPCTNSTHPTRWFARNSFFLIRFRTLSVTVGVCPVRLPQNSSVCFFCSANSSRCNAYVPARNYCI